MAPGNRRHIPSTVKEQMVEMSGKMKPGEIAQLLGVSPRTVHRVVKLSSVTGSVVKKPLQAGRRRVLNHQDIVFLKGCIEDAPDIHLKELQEKLNKECGVNASPATISRALKREGCTRKSAPSSSGDVVHTVLEEEENRRTAEIYEPEKLPGES